MEDSVEIPYKVMNKTTIWDSSPSTGHIYPAAAKLLQSCPTLCDPRDSSPPGSSVHGIFQARVLEWVAIAFSNIYPRQSVITKDTCTPIFISALFTIARTWKQPRCPLTEEWIKKQWYIYTMEYSVQFSSVAQSWILCNCKKECTWLSCNDVEELRAYSTEWSKSEREKQMPYINTCRGNLKRGYWWTYLQDSNRDADVENKLMDTVGEGECGANWDSRIKIAVLSYAN